MTKQIVTWATHVPIATEMSIYYDGTMLSRIWVMPKKKAISLEGAINMMIKQEEAAAAAGRNGSDPGHLFWYSYNFVEWISDMGYHIELTGDEFDAYFKNEMDI